MSSAFSLNNVILFGNVGRDPEKKVFENNGCITRLSVATERTWKNEAGERQKKTFWHNLVFKNKLGELAAQHIKSGGKLLVEGENEPREYEKDGQKHTVNEIIVEKFVFMPKSVTATESGAEED